MLRLLSCSGMESRVSFIVQQVSLGVLPACLSWRVEAAELWEVG